MGKIKYLIKRILKMDYKNMFRIAKAISKKTKKNTFMIIIDMIRCGIKYQAGYYDYQEFEFYNLNKEERKTYLTRGKNNEIVKKFNDRTSFHKFEDKAEFNSIFNKYLKRNWMVLNDNNYSDFEKFLKDNKAIIVKPIDDEGGNGVEKFVYSDDLNCKELYDKLVSNGQLLIEECIKQHEDMNVLYDKSVNTMRMFTFYKNGESFFLQAVLKIGNGGVVDNFSSGGMYTYVSDLGDVYVEAIDKDDNIYPTHPISNHKIVGFKVPMFKEAVELVKEAAKVIPEVAYVGWDVAISENGPVIVEGNCFPGVFQVKPSLVDKKEGLIPKYNEIMRIF
ncbi:MAG: hexapeptide transferase [Clostridia bacterium]|nr:hexapeptide transferase [Clostridia bacterium]